MTVERLMIPEIADFPGFGQKNKLLDIADGLRLINYTKTHPDFSPVWLRTQPITLLQSVVPQAAYKNLAHGTRRGYKVLKSTVRSIETGAPSAIPSS